MNPGTLPTRLAHANKGRSLELTVIQSQGNIVTLDQHGQEAKRVGAGKLIARKGPVDFTGTVNATGRSIRFDAKRCHLKTLFPIGDTTKFPIHQREHLIRHGRANAIAGLLVEATALGEYRWLDWRTLDEAWVSSIPWEHDCWVCLGPTTHAIRFERIPGVRVSVPAEGGDR